MRNLEAIESELSQAREALSHVTGTPAEVYSRIVGYYRSVRNWNRGKREEYGERLMFNPSCVAERRNELTGIPAPAVQEASEEIRNETLHLLLFVRPACPACPSAKAAASRLGLPVDMIDADTDEGLAEAVRRQVMSTPTAILLSSSGEELRRARDPQAISRILAE